jgi:hypothetical protein
MPSSLQVDQIQSADGVTTYLNSGTLSNLTFPAGHIIQTKFVSFDEDQSIGNGSSGGTTFTNIGSGVSGKEFSIDMSVSSGNKIYGSGFVNMSGSNRYSVLKIFVDSTQIAMGEAVSGRASGHQVTASITSNNDVTYYDLYMYQASFAFTHTPSDTNSYAYKIQAGNTLLANAITHINRTVGDTDSVYGVRGYSHFILMEIAQ